MLTLLRERRSIRRYHTRKLEEKELDVLKEALLRSPSSRNINPWEFIFIDDRTLLEQLSQSKQHGATFLKDASLGIVICGDKTKSDVWVEDCSIASILVQMAAQSIGLGSCWIQIRNRNHTSEITGEEYIQKLLHIPPEVSVESIISVGHPAEQPEAIPMEKLEYAKIHTNCW